MTATTQSPPLPTVTYNRDRSTRLTQVYDAQSHSEPDTIWKVTHDLATDIWRCPCKAGRHNRPCGHVHAAHLHELEREWRALWATEGNVSLAAAERSYARRAAAGEHDDDEEFGVAWDCLGDEVARRMAEQEAA